MTDAARTREAPLLDVAGLDAFYGRAQVLFDISLTIEAGTVTALVGRNGAGKSTILKALVGLVARRARRYRLMNEEMSDKPAYLLARAGIGLVPEDRRIFKSLTVAENLEAGRQPMRPGSPQWTPERLFALFPNLAEMRHRSAHAMSGGEQQMLAIARTLMGNPRLLLLDEPSEGLAPRIIDALADAVNELGRQGLTIILSEQNLRFCSRVASSALLIERGVIRYDGPLPTLLADEALKARYLAV